MSDKLSLPGEVGASQAESVSTLYFQVTAIPPSGMLVGKQRELLPKSIGAESQLQARTKKEKMLGMTVPFTSVEPIFLFFVLISGRSA